jgi:hypothetical protein
MKPYALELIYSRLEDPWAVLQSVVRAYKVDDPSTAFERAGPTAPRMPGCCWRAPGSAAAVRSS